MDCKVIEPLHYGPKEIGCAAIGINLVLAWADLIDTHMNVLALEIDPVTAKANFFFCKG